jgi:hypothetical protein
MSRPHPMPRARGGVSVLGEGLVLPLQEKEHLTAKLQATLQEAMQR